MRTYQDDLKDMVAEATPAYVDAGNLLIAAFTSHDPGAKYNKSWNDLMPACKKWDDLYTQDPGVMCDEYVDLCEMLDHFAGLYEIMPLFLQLVKCVTWYNWYLANKK